MQAEVNFLGQLHHPNLVKLIGYCSEDDQRLLVYEFMPRGSLENHLFRSESSQTLLANYMFTNKLSKEYSRECSTKLDISSVTVSFCGPIFMAWDQCLVSLSLILDLFREAIFVLIFIFIYFYLSIPENPNLPSHCALLKYCLFLQFLSVTITFHGAGSREIQYLFFLLTAVWIIFLCGM